MILDTWLFRSSPLPRTSNNILIICSRHRVIVQVQGVQRIYLWLLLWSLRATCDTESAPQRENFGGPLVALDTLWPTIIGIRTLHYNTCIQIAPTAFPSNEKGISTTMPEQISLFGKHPVKLLLQQFMSGKRMMFCGEGLLVSSEYSTVKETRDQRGRLHCTAARNHTSSDKK